MNELDGRRASPRPHPRRAKAAGLLTQGWAMLTAVVLVGVVTLGMALVRLTPVHADDPAALAARFTSTIAWDDCGDDLACAFVDAPLDWHDTATDSISLMLIKHGATGERKGTLVVNPGGPGGSGVDFVGGDVGQAVDASVAKHFDVIGFDPRGVGQSSAVSCYDAEGMDDYLYDILPGAIGSDEWLAASRKADAEFADACSDKTGALLDHVDTESVARDLDLIRADLGEKTLNYLGYSYGTYLGTRYAGLFPDRVGRFVFDGADDPWSDGEGGSAGDQAAAFDDDLRRYVAACIRHSVVAVAGGSCPFSGTADTGMGQVKSMLDTVAAAPLTAKDGRRLGDATLATAISSALYDTASWPDLTAALRGVESGDASGAFRLADAYNGRSPEGDYYDNSTEAFDAVNCLEFGGDDTTSTLRREAATLEAAAPVLGKYNAYGDLLCAQWPTDVADFPDPITAPDAGSILVIGSTGDPATPYSDAVALARQLRTGHLLTRVGDGHTAYAKGNGCIDAAVDAFVVTGTVPEGGAARCH